MPPDATDVRRALERSQRLADFLDQAHRLPGTSIRFGYDAVIGLVPVVGDSLTFLFGLYPVLEAVRFRVRKRAIGRMLINLVFDWLIGLIPLVDLVLDVAYKANLRNVRLLAAELQRRERPLH